MVRVTGIHRLGLGVPALQPASDFYLHRWGMDSAGSDGDERTFRSKGCGHGDLLLRRSDEATLDHIALSVASEADLDALLATVERAGFAVAQQPRRGQRPGEALLAAVDDRDGNRVELVVPAPAAEATARADDAAADGPRKLGHVVLWTPRPDAQEAFYALLGFRVSDRTHIGMSFLRCNTDHHTIAFVRSARGRTGLQHAAFDVGSIDNVMRAYGRLRDEGIACIWGVGRHGPGNNVFSYYRDPANNVVEFYGDMETVPLAEDVATRVWGAEHKGDVWGVAGAPPEPFRD